MKNVIGGSLELRSRTPVLRRIGSRVAVLSLFAAVIVPGFPAPVYAGNLIYNSSFEKTTNPGVPDGFQRHLPPDIVPKASREDWGVVEQGAYHGKRCMRSTPKSGIRIKAVELKPGQDYTFSVYARAEKPDSSIGISSWYGGVASGTNISVGTEWKRATWSIPASDKKQSVSVGCWNSSQGKIWWDAAQLEPGPQATDYAPEFNDPKEEARLHGKPKDTPRYDAERTPEQPKIDGVLDDACWQKRSKIIFPSPTLGEKAATEVMVTRDDTFVYFGIICHEPDTSKMRARYTQHDEPVYSDDSLELFIDSENKLRTYYHFMLNCAGAKAEEFCFLINKQWLWNGAWEAAVTRQDDRWIAEIAIPFTSLAQGHEMSDTWGVNIGRSRSHANEYIPWYGKYHAPETFPEIKGLKPETSGLRDVSFGYHLGAKPGALMVEYSVQNPGKSSVRIRPTLMVYTGASETGKPQALPEREIGGGATEKIAVSVPIDAKSREMRFQLEARDLDGRKIFLSTPQAVDLSRLVDGPGPDYDMYFSDEKEMDCVLDLGKIRALSDCELKFIVRDCADTVHWQKKMPVKEDSCRMKIPLEGAAGACQLEVRIAQGGAVAAERTFKFRRLPPPAGSVVRVNRHRRALEVDGKPFVGFGSSASALAEPDVLRAQLEDFKSQGINCVYLWNIGRRNMLAASNDLGKSLDLAREYGMKVYVDLSSLLRNAYKEGRTLERLDCLAAAIKKHKTHPALLAWDLMDEPSPDQVPVQYVETLYRFVHEIDPYHPVTLNVNCDAARFIDWSTVSDIASIDYYPLMYGAHPSGTFYVAAGMEALAPFRPFRFWLESFSDLDATSANREPTPQELQSMAYTVAVYGCTQFLYFSYKPMSLDLYNMWGQCNRELSSIPDAMTAAKRLHPAILPENNSVHASVRFTDKGVVILAVNVADESQAVDIQLPEGCESDSATVLFENRTVPVKNGKIRDTFNKLERHVYQVEKQQGQTVK